MNDFGIVGTTTAICTMRDAIRKVSHAPYPVLVTGETGTGKELVARAIHAQSPRAAQTFVSLCCGAVSTTLTESILFGHTRGAFTGAHQATSGLFLAAHRGTLFLDEIDTMTPEMQACLLRAVETGEVRQVGRTTPTLVDVRIISASNVDQHQLIREGGFRQDLYYRLSAITIHVPPLRERAADIPLLAKHFLRITARETRTTAPRLTHEAARTLQSHAWPGNVRELQNAIRQACLLTTRDRLDAHDFAFLWNPPASRSQDLMTVREYAQAAIRTFGDVLRAKDLSAALGISRKTLWHWRKAIPLNGNHVHPAVSKPERR